ncbi:helix-turn-helix domain-containing protein [Prescottella agglutinans]|uniref:Transcriptional regulator with XRE-family HTH domain n=1 Tax=Prescottella agglutinans TaxID=1644129 RepID=A0ABT6MH74_9NOCA|nr:helix-turn-helix transcriptional regulator [Prescottella agglutinans]MDH6283146.1 transcriptional regulator with XRE-family HTH domain [Prescottella agglutinans]
MTTKWWDYVERHLAEKGMTQSALAEAVGVNRSSASGWKSGSDPKPATVVAVAEVLETSISEALIAAGLMSEEELGVERTIPDIELLTDDQLMAELNRRLKNVNSGEPKKAATRRTATPRTTQQPKKTTVQGKRRAHKPTGGNK